MRSTLLRALGPAQRLLTAGLRPPGLVVWELGSSYRGAGTYGTSETVSPLYPRVRKKGNVTSAVSLSQITGSIWCAPPRAPSIDVLASDPLRRTRSAKRAPRDSNQQSAPVLLTSPARSAGNWAGEPGPRAASRSVRNDAVHGVTAAWRLIPAVPKTRLPAAGKR
ncbi:hypothetical protein GCM10027562_01850 [Arthrobacter pigmenti]